MLATLMAQDALERLGVCDENDFRRLQGESRAWSRVAEIIRNGPKVFKNRQGDE